MVAVLVANEDNVFFNVACVENAAVFAGEANELTCVVFVGVFVILVAEQSDHRLMVLGLVVDLDRRLTVDASCGLVAVDSKNLAVLEYEQAVFDSRTQTGDVRDFRIVHNDTCAALLVVVVDDDIGIGCSEGMDSVLTALAQVDNSCFSAGDDDIVVACAVVNGNGVIVGVAVHDDEVALGAEVDDFVAVSVFRNDSQVVAGVVERDATGIIVVKEDPHSVICMFAGGVVDGYFGRGESLKFRVECYCGSNCICAVSFTDDSGRCFLERTRGYQFARHVNPSVVCCDKRVSRIILIGAEALVLLGEAVDVVIFVADSQIGLG